MVTQRKKWLSGVVAGLLMAASVTASAEEKTLHVYNWSDYIAPDTLAKFQKETGIKVVYDVFDSNEVLEGKLMAGSTGYDLVVPSSNFLERQSQAGIFEPLDKSKIPNYKNLDPEMLKLVAHNDKDNKYGIPYMMVTTGIGYNVDKVKAALGKDAPVNSWDLIFKPENLEKLKSCGVSFLDAPSEVYATVLHYLGKDPNSTNADDYKAALDVLMKIRPYIRQFSSSGYIDELAVGDLCMVYGFSGDVMIARKRAQDAKKSYEVNYFIPKGGAPAWFDLMVIPKDAPHPEEALAFINYIETPKVHAAITNTMFYPNANKEARQYVVKDVADNPMIYPPAEVSKTLYVIKALPLNIQRLQNRMWSELKSGR